MSQEEEGGKVNQTVSEHARRESLTADAFDLPRWVPEHTGPYDLGDPYDNHFAFAKAQANLSGDYYWLAQYGWILICPPGDPAQLLVHLTGMKTHDPAKMPSFIRTHVMERFPDRFL